MTSPSNQTQTSGTEPPDLIAGDSVAETTPVRVTIIDDDPIAVTVLKDMLQKYDWVEVCGTAFTLEDGCRLVETLRPELVFLDIELNETTGLDLLEELDVPNGETPRVIFYTAYPRYMLNALRMQAFDFLLKPVDVAELSLILERYRLHRGGCAPQLHSKGEIRPVATAASVRTPRSMTVSTVTNERLVVAPSDIVYFKYDQMRKLWEVILKNMKRYVLRRHTTAETLLSLSEQFVRTHKTYIVNAGYLAKISDTECELVPPFNRITEIKISRTYRRGLLDCFYDL
ncbi:MAG: LytTR family DNA-binding domain-containing protein [Muribaculaceae bacterium]|nr:LytTR family DNA-binding domain-containing protein [Muribaculaceae bacterium]